MYLIYLYINPSKKDILKIQTLVEKIQNNSKHLPKWLKEWNTTMIYPLENATYLVFNGIDEMIHLGQRLRSFLYSSSTTTIPHYTFSTYSFQHTYKLRTKQSAQA